MDNGKTLFLGYSEIPSDDSQTLLEISVEDFKNLAVTASDCSEGTHLDGVNTVNQNDFQVELIRKLNCLMSDRFQ